MAWSVSEFWRCCIWPHRSQQTRACWLLSRLGKPLGCCYVFAAACWAAACYDLAFLSAAAAAAVAGVVVLLLQTACSCWTGNVWRCCLRTSSKSGQWLFWVGARPALAGSSSPRYNRSSSSNSDVPRLKVCCCTASMQPFCAATHDQRSE